MRNQRSIRKQRILPPHRPNKRPFIERPELFLLPNETIYAMVPSETEATYAAMEELGIAHLPYPLVDVGIPGSLVMQWNHNDELGGHSIRIALPGMPVHTWNKDGHNPLTCPACKQNVTLTPGTPAYEKVQTAIRNLSQDYQDNYNSNKYGQYGNIHYSTEDLDELSKHTEVMPHGEELRKIVELTDSPYKEWVLRYRFENEKPIMMMATTPDGKVYEVGVFTEFANPGTDARKQLASGAANMIRKMLIVLLATRNVVKERTKDKLLAMGIGKHKNNYRPLYTTSLVLPRSYVKDDGQPANMGTTKAPHLRRGHLRNQPYGPKLAFVKRIWIKPCFINADEDFVSSRSAYNTSMGTNHPLLAKDESNDLPRSE